MERVDSPGYVDSVMGGSSKTWESCGCVHGIAVMLEMFESAVGLSKQSPTWRSEACSAPAWETWPVLARWAGCKVAKW